MTKRTVGSVVAVMALACGSVLAIVPAVSGRTERPTDEIFLFVLIEADAFLCSPCLGRTLDLCREVGPNQSRVHLGAIVLYQRPTRDVDPEPYRLMVARRAQSVFRANGLTCPVMVDEAGHWEAYSSQGMDLVVLDGRTHIVRGLALPLERAELEMILHAQTQGGNARE